LESRDAPRLLLRERDQEGLEVLVAVVFGAVNEDADPAELETESGDQNPMRPDPCGNAGLELTRHICWIDGWEILLNCERAGPQRQVWMEGCESWMEPGGDRKIEGVEGPTIRLVRKSPIATKRVTEVTEADVAQPKARLKRPDYSARDFGPCGELLVWWPLRFEGDRSPEQRHRP